MPLGQSSLIMLCAGSTLLLTPVVRPTNVSGINLLKTFLPPTGRFNLGFILRERLAAVLITPSSWGFPTRHHKQQEFLAPLPGRKKLSARGVSHSQSLYFVFCFALFILFCLVCFFIKNTKKLVPVLSCFYV